MSDDQAVLAAEDGRCGSDLLKASIQRLFRKWERRHGFKEGAAQILLPAGYIAKPTANADTFKCGHPRADGNLMLEKGRYYRCRACHRERSLSYWKRRQTKLVEERQTRGALTPVERCTLLAKVERELREARFAAFGMADA